MKILPYLGLATGLVILSGANALAAPQYLSCAFAQPSGEPQLFNFALDQAAGTLGVYVPSTGSQRKVKAEFAAGKVSANEGFVAWEIAPSTLSVIRDKRTVGEKDRGVCKQISAGEAGFEE